jgi:2-keto-3-deoxy-L-rhamnonate aldolase RhmA
MIVAIIISFDRVIMKCASLFIIEVYKETSMPVKRLREGARIVGTMIRLVRNPAIASIAKHSGLDFIMLDLEHGSYSMESVADIFKVARAIGLGSFVRVPELSKGYVSRAMDCGAAGVMAPMVETAEQARALAAWAKYAPLGRRGLGGSGGHTDFAGIVDAPAFMRDANEESLTIAQIETAEAVKNVEAIASVEGIDALLIGPNDLAISLGCPGSFTSDVMNSSIEKVAAAAGRKNKILGMHGTDELLNKWMDHGLRLIMSLLDVNMLFAGMKGVVDKYGI